MSAVVSSVKNCSICLRDITKDAEAASCGHVYHHVCLRTWLASKKTCPICKTPQEIQQIAERPLRDHSRRSIAPVMSNYGVVRVDDLRMLAGEVGQRHNGALLYEEYRQVLAAELLQLEELNRPQLERDRAFMQRAVADLARAVELLARASFLLFSFLESPEINRLQALQSQIEGENPRNQESFDWEHPFGQPHDFDWERPLG